MDCYDFVIDCDGMSAEVKHDLALVLDNYITGFTFNLLLVCFIERLLEIFYLLAFAWSLFGKLRLQC